MSSFDYTRNTSVFKKNKNNSARYQDEYDTSSNLKMDRQLESMYQKAYKMGLAEGRSAKNSDRINHHDDSNENAPKRRESMIESIANRKNTGKQKPHITYIPESNYEDYEEYTPYEPPQRKILKAPTRQEHSDYIPVSKFAPKKQNKKVVYNEPEDYDYDEEDYIEDKVDNFIESKYTFNNFLVFMVALLSSIILFGSLYLYFPKPAATMDEIKKLIYLGTSEEPQVYTIQDSDALAAKNPTFKNVMKGDILMTYQKSKVIVVYRPSMKKVITVVPVE